MPSRCAQVLLHPLEVRRRAVRRLRRVCPGGARLAQPAHQLLGLAHGQPLADHRAEHVGLAVDRRGRRARARGPRVSRPSAIAAWTSGWRSSSRSVFATVGPGLARRAPRRVPGSARTRRSAGGTRAPRRSGRGRRAARSRRGRPRAGRDRRAGGRARGSARGREAGRAHASLAGDELVAVERLRDEDRLQHAVLADARRELLEHGVVHPAAGLVRVGRDARERRPRRPRPGPVGRCGISDASPSSRARSRCGRGLRRSCRRLPA